MRSLLLALAAALAVAGAADAHPLAPALLELREVGQGRVDVHWRAAPFVVPGAPMRPVLPASCIDRGARSEGMESGAVVTRWTAECGPAGLVGQSVAVEGLGAAGTEALVRVVLPDGRTVQKVLRPTEPDFVVPPRPSTIAVLWDYARLGVGHILTGPDHLAFVAGLFLLVGAGRLLVKTITAFTLGHSVTLALVVLDVLHVRARIAELAIALTVLALANELARPAGTPSAMRRWPWLMAAVFGLLHGLGFAGALREVGLPDGEIPTALLGFNVGIEAGQLGFVAALLVATAIVRRLVPRLPAWAAQAPAYAIGALAAFWCFERAFPFFQ
ncbi:MAG: HupE/UreJ family protein [Candidatus Binatia bacterium]